MKIIILIFSFIFIASCEKGKDSLEDVLSVKNGSGNSGELVNAVSSIIPQSGSTTLNTNLTILGSGFNSGVLQVFIGAVQCTGVTIVNDIQATCTVAPQAAGQYDVRVTLDGVELTNIINGFVYLTDFGASFNVTSISPVNGGTAGGTTVTVNGSDFDGTVIFQVDGTNCQTTTIINSTTGTCVTPANALGYYDFSAKKGPETKTLTNVFQYTGPPTITNVNLANVPATIPTVITITGTNFVSGADVEFQTNVGNYNCNSVTVSLGGTQMTCSTPALSVGIASSIIGAATIQVENPDATSDTLAASISFDPPPIFGSISFTGGITAAPIDGVMKTTSTLGVPDFTMSIFGTNLSAGLSVTVGGLAAGGCTRINSTQIDCTSLPDQGSILTTSKNLVILNPDGQSLTESIVLAGRPNITLITPGIDVPTGGANIDFMGTNLTGANPIINFRNDANTVDLGTCTVVSPSVPRCTTPNVGSAQNIDIRYQNSYGYWEDFDGLFALTDPADMLVTWPAIEDGSGNNTLGKISKGTTAQIVARLHNTSGAVSITAVSIDATALAPTNYSYNAGDSNCGGTIAPGTFCDIYFDYTASALEVISTTGNVNISYHNGVALDSESFNFINTWVVPIKLLWKERYFGDIPNGNNHNGDPARHMHVLQIENPTNSSVAINLGATTFSGSAFKFPGGAFPGTHPSTRIQAEECPATGIIPANTKCLITIAFEPNATAAFSETLTITYNGAETKTVSLTGDSTSTTKITCNPASSANFGGGAGTIGNPYLLCSKQHIEDLSDWTWAESDPYPYRESYYLQTADIDLDSPIGGEIEPILLNTNSYGHYDGGGYVMANRVWSSDIDSNAGLFRGNGYFKNVQVVDFDSICATYCGLISNAGTIYLDNSYATGEVTASSQFSAGLIGRPNAGYIKNSYVHADVSGSDSDTGIISGRLNSTGSFLVEDTYAYGTATQVSAANYSGGISGWVGSGSILTIDNVQIAADLVYLSGSYKGGFVGYVASGGTVNISNSKFTGELTNVGTYTAGFVGIGLDGATVIIDKSGMEGVVYAPSQYVGGFTGYARDVTSFITKSYMSGSVSASDRMGGLSGYAGNVEDNMVLGTVTCTSSDDTRIGGMAWYSLYSLDNSYIASIPAGVRRVNYTAATRNAIHGHTGGGHAATNIYFLDGVGTDQSATVGVLNRTDAQMKVSLPGLTDNAAVWKYAPSGYPYPMLVWMDDDWMP